MADSDLLPASIDPHATTKTLKRKTMAIKLSPEATANLTLGVIVSGSFALVIGTIFVWQIKTNGEQALAEIKAMREETAPAMRKVDRLWWEYEARTASRGSVPGSQP